MSLLGSTSGDPLPLRRGLISCLHSPACRRTDDAPPQQLLRRTKLPLPTDKELPKAIHDLIVGFYDQAFARLPCETMPPDLHRLLSTCGLCLGLLDPVSNIILNTIALLPDGFAAAAAASASPPPAKRSKRLARGALPGADRGRRPWLEVAVMSYYSLIDFLITYFGCLTMEQAIRYLYWAGADLLLAVNLVQHDLHQDQDGDLDMQLQPASARTKAALRWSADRVGHPEPAIVADLMAVRLYDHDFHSLMMRVADGSVLTPDDVRHVQRMLQPLMRPPCDAQVNQVVGEGGDDSVVVRVAWNLRGVAETTNIVDVTSADGRTTTRTMTTTIRRLGQPITSLRRRGLSDMLSERLELAAAAACCGEEDTLKIQCSDGCEYLRSLRMYAHGMIHGFYLQALALLPAPPSGLLMRTFLMAGHCYGSMDPVSNIIVNFMWYNKHVCPLSESDRNKIEPYTDILDPLSLLRPVVRSLKGFMELTAFADRSADRPRFSVPAYALEALCSAKWDVVDMFPGWSLSYENNPFRKAALAAGHPLPFELGELHLRLLIDSDGRNKLLSLMTEARRTCSVLPIQEIACFLDIMLSSPMVPTPVQAPKLCLDALSGVAKKMTQYEARRVIFRKKIELLLEKYASQHFWEPKYTLDFICGVEEIGRGPHTYDNKCYHVNFMASSEPQLERRTLFFAEFWHSHEPKPSFCCPLPSPYAGRCYYGVHSARKLAYPDCEEYILEDITERGTGDVHTMLEADIVYLSSERDVDVALQLNRSYAGDFPVSRRPAALRC